MFSPVFREEWRIIRNQLVKPGMYSISNAGRVKNNYTGLILKQGIINSGYLVVPLRCSDIPSRHFLIHRLVCEEFVNNDDPLRNTVNHKDGNKLLDHFYNLEWATQSENNEHAKENGLNHGFADTHYKAKLTNAQVEKICEMLVANCRYKDILDTIGLDSSDATHNNNYDLIGNIKRGIAWSSISKNYNFPENRVSPIYTNDQVRQMCEFLTQSVPAKEAYEKITGKIYVSSVVNKKFYEFYRKLKNREVCTAISKTYDF